MELRHPVATLTVKGNNIDCEDVSIKLSRDAKTDTLSAIIPLFGTGPNADFWSSQNSLDVQCQISTGDGKSAKLFDGFIDSVECDFGQGKVSISARDKSAKMIDKKAGKKHLNKKPHEIVQQYASDNGLGYEGDQVSEKAGRTFQIDYVALIHRMSDWHACQHVAEAHGMTCYATAGKVYFKKIPESLPTYSVNFARPSIGGSAGGSELTLTAKRNVQLGKTIKTLMHSWNHKNQKQYEATASEAGAGDTLEFHLHHPGLTQEQANSRAKAHLTKATKHELEVRVEVPGDPTISARMNLQITGTASAWDQLHEINSVEHKISVGGGYTTTIDTKTKSKKRGK